MSNGQNHHGEQSFWEQTQSHAAQLATKVAAVAAALGVLPAETGGQHQGAVSGTTHLGFKRKLPWKLAVTLPQRPCTSEPPGVQCLLC